MSRLTKTILVALYMVQVGVAFHSHLTTFLSQTIAALVPARDTVRTIVQNVVLAPADRPSTMRNEVSVTPATPLAQMPIAVMAVVGEIQLPYSTDHQTGHDKDRIKRHRRLHGFRGPERYYGNLAASLLKLGPPPGHDLAFAGLCQPLTLFNSQQA